MMNEPTTATCPGGYRAPVVATAAQAEKPVLYIADHLGAWGPAAPIVSGEATLPNDSLVVGSRCARDTIDSACRGKGSAT